METYRRCLVLPGEEPNKIIAEVHHRMDFESESVRHLSTLWKAPVIVTTAVAFFETLASNRPSALRRLHELPGSAILLMKHTPHCLRIFCRLHGNGSTASLTSGIAIGFLRRVLSTDSGRFSRLRQPEPGECQLWLTTRFVPRWRSMSRTASGISGIPHS